LPSNLRYLAVVHPLSKASETKIKFMSQKFQPILGINFFTGSMPELLELCAEGKFIVAPAAPALAELLRNAAYRESVEKSDLAVSDSSLMVILWKLLAGQHLNRTSGPVLLRALLDSGQLREPGNSVWIMPSEGESQINVAYLNKIGIPVSAKDCYIAPHYPKGEPGFDLELLAWIEERKPRYVIINIGGGIQEPLGLYLKENLCYRPSIICVGSAIAFFSGIQASLPRWIDKCMLGWLSRCLHSPAKFVPRYWGALRAIPIMIKYRERSVTSTA
jgi:N-acetylglucosaminyldiphosphoundecaprenol N-acetyl-beta-D-mannosaminyltransferase